MDSTHNPADRTHGAFLFRSMQTPGQTTSGGALLNTRAWNRAAEDGYAVGDCRVCGHHIFALPTEVVGRITWYTAECRNCGHIIASPNGEILIRSGRHSEMPAGFFDGRPGTRKTF